MSAKVPQYPFSADLRIRRGDDFRRAFRQGRSAFDPHLTVYAYANGLEYARLGLSVGRRYGNAVARNAWKRRIREAFRLNRARLLAGYDYVVLPRGGELPPFATLVESLVPLAEQAARRASRRRSSKSPGE